MKVAVVHNQHSDGVIHRFGQPCVEHYNPDTIALVAAGLQSAGHEVVLLEGDKSLLANLEAFAAGGKSWRCSPSENASELMVFNMAYGIQGQSRYTHVPAMLEMAGVAYTGSGPLGHAIALDKVITKIQMQQAGVPTPNWAVMAGPEDLCELEFPLIVKPRHESTSFGLFLVHTRHELARAVEAIVTQYEQEALVEEYIEGREINIGLLGQNPTETLPPLELVFQGRPLHIVTLDDKHHLAANEPEKVCPAPLESRLEEYLRSLAITTFKACHLKDYARVDIRIDQQGRPYVLEINSMAALGRSGSYVTAAQAAGYTHEQLVCRILEIACRRSFGAASLIPVH